MSSPGPFQWYARRLYGNRAKTRAHGSKAARRKYYDKYERDPCGFKAAWLYVYLEPYSRLVAIDPKQASHDQFVVSTFTGRIVGIHMAILNDDSQQLNDRKLRQRIQELEMDVDALEKQLADERRKVKSSTSTGNEATFNPPDVSRSWKHTRFCRAHAYSHPWYSSAFIAVRATTANGIAVHIRSTRLSPSLLSWSTLQARLS